MSNSGMTARQNALAAWQVQREQECALRNALTFEDPDIAAPKKRALCVSCIAGAGVIVVAATMLLGSGILS